MPQPLKKQHAPLSWTDRLLMQRPDHAIRLATIAAEWAALEQMLSFLFAYAFGDVELSGIALTVLDTVQSLKARLDIIKEVSKHSLPLPLSKEFISNIMPEVRRRARDRNLVVHAHWALCADYPNDLILHPAIGDPVRYSVKDLDGIIDRMIATRHLLGNFWKRVQGEKSETPSPLIPQKQ